MPRALPVALLVMVALAAGCGEQAQRASRSSDVDALLRTTFVNLDKMKSGTVDVNLRLEPQGAGAQTPVAVRLQGPFASEGTGRLPKFDFDATLQSGTQQVTGGATWTGEKGFASLQGTDYELSDLVMKQFAAGYEQTLKSRKGGLVLGSLGIDFTHWLRDARNDGAARVGDTDTVKISGTADVARVVEDLAKISDRARTLGIPGASGQLPQQLTPEQRRQAIAAIKSLAVTVFTGARDHILRRLTVAADVQDAGTREKLALDIEFTKVGAAQVFPEPAHPKSFAAFVKAANAAGLGNLGLGGDATAVAPAGAPQNNVDRYAACIQQANGDEQKARRCAELLSG